MGRIAQNIAIACLLVWSLCQPVLAQRLTNEMDAQCRKWYELAMKDVGNKRSLLYADSIAERGNRLGLRMCRFRAELIRTFHYSRYNNFVRLHEAAEELREVALAENERRTYFYSYDLEVNNRLKYGMTLNALNVAREMVAKVTSKESDYAKYISMRALGKVYYHRRDYRHAAASLDSALVFAAGACRERKGLKTSDAHVMLGDAQAHLGKWDLAYKHFASGLALADDRPDSIAACLSFAHMQALHDDEGSFRSMYAMATNLAKGKTLSKEQAQTLTLLKAYNMMFDKDYAAALKTSEQLTSEELRTQLQRDIYTKKGEHFNALACEKKLIYLKDSIYLRFTTQDIMLLNQQHNNNEMRSHAARQAAELLQMRILQQLQKQQQAAIRARNNELQAETERKQAREDSLIAEAELNKSRIKRLQTDRKKKLALEEAHRTYFINTIMCVAIFVLICVGICVAFIMKRNLSTAKKLEVLAKQLKRAHHLAWNTNKIKTTFIQNMNYEVRAPLNEVMGFAQLLSSKEMELSDDERAEYGQHITDSAMTLNALIDNILTIADVESGKWEVAPVEHRVSDILPQAINAAQQKASLRANIVCDPEAYKDITLLTDGRRVQQILTNLLKEALKHTKDNTVYLDCCEDKEQDTVTFAVADIGGRPPEEVVANVLESLADEQGANSVPYLTLGLCKLMAERLNGKIMYDESYDKGIRTMVILPKGMKKG